MEVDRASPGQGNVHREALVKLAFIRPLLAKGILWLIAEQMTGGIDGEGMDGDEWSPLCHILHRELRALSKTVGYLDERLEREDRVARDQSVALSSESAGETRKQTLTVLPAILASTQQEASTLVRRFSQSDDKVRRDIIIDIVWRELQFATALKKTSTGEETLAHLNFLHLSNPPHDFWERIGRPVASVAALLSLRGLKFPTSNDAVMCERASILTSALFDLPPGGYYTEKLSYRLLSHVEPQLTQATIGWLQDANTTSWTDFRHHIIPLLSESHANNFAHLVIAYAADRWPLYFGWDSPDPGPRNTLTKALLTRDIKPIHFAAALGLSQLVGDVIIHGTANASHISHTVGSPIFCALYGEDIFSWRTIMLGQQRLGGHFPDVSYDRHRILVIVKLLANRETTLPTASWQVTPAMSICSLAFSAAYESREHLFWNKFLDSCPKFDKALVNTIRGIGVLRDEENHHIKRRVLSMLLTALMDHTLLRTALNDWEEELNMEVQGAIALCLEYNHLEFEPYDIDAGLGSLQLTELEDNRYTALLHSTLLTGAVFIFKRLMLEPRFEAALLRVPNRQDTLLHLAVAGDHFSIVELLIEDGADLFATDSEGRTPLMVSESTRMVTLLVQQHNADTTVTDDLGRNIWHLAGGSNDADLMKWLCRNDPFRAENMNARSLEGNTPLAEAVLYINRLSEQAPHAVSIQRRHPAAAMAFFHHCQAPIDDDFLWSAVPITHVAAEWGYLGLINRLAKVGADFTQLNKHRQSALYRIPLSASPTVVARLQELCGGDASPIADDTSHTPAEVIFHHVKFLDDEDDDPDPEAVSGLQLSAHPFCARQLSPHSYELLLTPETLAWQDGQGRGLWERFCADVLMKHPVPPHEEIYRPVAFLYESIKTALWCLIGSNATEDYERRTGRAAITCFDPRQMTMLYQTSEENLETLSDETGKMRALGPMFKPRGERRWWNVEYLAPYMTILIHSMQGPTADAFYASEDARTMLQEAEDADNLALSTWITARMNL